MIGAGARWGFGGVVWAKTGTFANIWEHGWAERCVKREGDEGDRVKVGCGGFVCGGIGVFEAGMRIGGFVRALLMFDGAP